MTNSPDQPAADRSLYSVDEVGAMIAALAQSQLPDFSFRSDLLRSRSIAKFIGKLDGGGRLQREDLVYRDVDLDNREYELPEQAFEFRGPMWLGARQLDLGAHQRRHLRGGFLDQIADRRIGLGCMRIHQRDRGHRGWNGAILAIAIAHEHVLPASV